MLEPEPELVALVAVAGARDAEVALAARRLLALAPRGRVHPVAPLRSRLSFALLEGSLPATTNTRTGQRRSVFLVGSFVRSFVMLFFRGRK